MCARVFECRYEATVHSTMFLLNAYDILGWAASTGTPGLVLGAVLDVAKTSNPAEAGVDAKVIVAKQVC